MRQDWEPEDLIEVWTLLEDDMKKVRNKSGATRLGFALLLKFFEVEAEERRPARAGMVDGRPDTRGGGLLGGGEHGKTGAQGVAGVHGISLHTGACLSQARDGVLVDVEPCALMPGLGIAHGSESSQARDGVEQFVVAAHSLAPHPPARARLHLGEGFLTSYRHGFQCDPLWCWWCGEVRGYNHRHLTGLPVVRPPTPGAGRGGLCRTRD